METSLPEACFLPELARGMPRAHDSMLGLVNVRNLVPSSFLFLSTKHDRDHGVIAWNVRHQISQLVMSACVQDAPLEKRGEVSAPSDGVALWQMALEVLDVRVDPELELFID